MTPDLLGIGELARLSGLTVSALRFYDREGVLRPAAVDPATGYRRYAAAQLRPARLVAGMRRIGVPLAEITVAVDELELGGDVDSVRGILADHLARLEEGLEDARREVDRLAAVLAEAADSAGPGEWGLDAGDLVEALRAVRFAAGSDPEFPVLHGVLLELGPTTCTVVATDRYRLACSTLPLTAGEGTAHAVAPTAWVDAVLAAGPTGPARVRVTAGAVHLVTGEGETSGDLVPGDYPDHRRVVAHLPADPAQVAPPRSGRAPGTATSPRRRDLGEGEVDARGLAGLVRGVSPRHTGEDGSALVLLGARDGAAAVTDADGVAVNREFLLEALDAAGTAPTLHLDGPITPLLVRRDERTWSVLMPARLPEQAS